MLLAYGLQSELDCLLVLIRATDSRFHLLDSFIVANSDVTLHYTRVAHASRSSKHVAGYLVSSSKPYLHTGPNSCPNQTQPECAVGNIGVTNTGLTSYSEQ